MSAPESEEAIRAGLHAVTIRCEMDERLSRVSQTVWNWVRPPLTGILLLVMPVVQCVCTLGLVLGMLTSVVFELSAAGPQFPFLRVVGISLSVGVLPVLCCGVLSHLIRD